MPEERTVTVERIGPRPLAILRLHSADSAALGALGLPQAPNAWVSGRLRLGPGEWLIQGDTSDLAVILEERLHHLADVAGGCVVWRIAGPAAPDLIACGCSLDLHSRAFPQATGARTLLGGVVVVISRVAPAVFELAAASAYAAYLDAWLAEAGRGFADDTRVH